MTVDEVISQIENMKEYSQSFINKDSEPIWEDDVEACDLVLSLLKVMEFPVRLNDTEYAFLHNGDINIMHCANKRECDRYFKNEVKYGKSSR